MNRTVVAAGAAALLSFGSAAAAHAQALEEIVVTAQKRDETAFQVPAAITAYGQTFLIENRIQSFDDLARFVPGLQVSAQSPNNTGFSIRGITTDDGSSNQDTRVSIFQDGVSISRSRGSVAELFDMERVEVLKGPQGTLFGRGAEIGAISMISNKPKNVFEGALEVGAGRYNWREVEGMLNVPVIDDKVLVRGAVVHRERDGFITNIAGGTLNGLGTTALRPSVRIKPVDSVTFDVAYNYQRDDYPGTGFKSKVLPPTGGDTSPFTAAELDAGERLGIRREVHSVTGTLNVDINSAWRLTAISNYRWYNSYELFDADGSQLRFIEASEYYLGRQLSQEVRVAFDDGGRFKGFGGVNFFHERGEQRVHLGTDERQAFVVLAGPRFGIPLLVNGRPNTAVTRLPVAPFTPLLPFQDNQNSNLGETDAIEAFADGTLQVTDQFSVTAGVRVTHEDIDGRYRALASNPPTDLAILGLAAGPNLLFPPTNGTLSTSGRFTSAVGRVVGEYKFNDDVRAYASWSRGRRPPVQQIDQTLLRPNNLAAEEVDSYEIGLKTRLLDHRLQFDVAGFYYDYNHFQTTILQPNGQFTSTDGGTATSYGVEAQAVARVTQGVETFATFAWLHGRFDDVGENGQRQQFAGNRFRNQPDWSGSVGANLTLAAGSGELFLTPSMTFQSKIYFDYPNDPATSQGAYALVNLRTGIRGPDHRWEVALWGKNILSRRYLIDAGNTGKAFGFTTYIPGTPATVGVEARVRF